MEDKRYCVYFHKKKTTGEIYYIGSGVKNKREFHFSNRSKAWHEIHTACGTDVEIYKDNLSCKESRILEQSLIDSGNYPYIVNSRKVLVNCDIDRDKLIEIVKYDETSPTCLRFIKSSGPRGKVGNPAGTLKYDAMGRPRRATVQVMNTNTACSRIIWVLHNENIPNGFIIDHIDGNPHNNKISNLRCISLKENALNRKQKIGKQLPNGIYLRNEAIVAVVADGNEKSMASFSIKLYGYEEALSMAKSWRLSKLKEFELIDMYSERHIGFDIEEYSSICVTRKTTASSGLDNIWIKRDKHGNPKSVSSGVSRTNRKYFSIYEKRTFEEAMELAKQHLESLTLDLKKD